jgi:hypothetical protein
VAVQMVEDFGGGSIGKTPATGLGFELTLENLN